MSMYLANLASFDLVLKSEKIRTIFHQMTNQKLQTVKDRSKTEKIYFGIFFFFAFRYNLA